MGPTRDPGVGVPAPSLRCAQAGVGSAPGESCVPPLGRAPGQSQGKSLEVVGDYVTGELFLLEKHWKKFNHRV